jgi:hypothetical protein
MEEIDGIISGLERDDLERWLGLSMCRRLLVRLAE